MKPRSDSVPGGVHFRLYVAGDAPNAQRAIANLTAFCKQHLPTSHDLEIVDVFEEPQRALDDRVLMTPTLAIISTRPTRIVVGDLSDSTILPLMLGLEIKTA